MMKSDTLKSQKVISLRISTNSLDKIDRFLAEGQMYNTRNDLILNAVRSGYKRLGFALRKAANHDEYALLAGILVGMKQTSMMFEREGNKDTQILIRIPEGFYNTLVQLTSSLNISLLDLFKSELYLYIHRIGPFEKNERYLDLLPKIDMARLQESLDEEEAMILHYGINEADMD